MNPMAFVLVDAVFLQEMEAAQERLLSARMERKPWDAVEQNARVVMVLARRLGWWRSCWGGR